MDNTKRIVATLGSDDSEEIAHLKDIIPTPEGLRRRVADAAKQVADAAKQVHEDNIKTRKKEFRDFINRKSVRGSNDS